MNLLSRENETGVVRVFKTKVFARFARKEGISDTTLLAAITAAEVSPDADLGGGVIKQRVARPNQGKSEGYRTIILYRKGDRAFFVYGFPKSGLGNINQAQMQVFGSLRRSFSMQPMLKFNIAARW
ncbi:MAG: type II toxin-antitoxin system RelE/ParE family toxin [Chloroflexota bacterium]|nr:type II toxin-antitoxin system RelE/ParE family toxin [Chloroflexota bacterium]